MIQFRTALKTKLIELVTQWTGPGAITPWVKTFDDHLYSVDIAKLPFVVVNVRQVEVSEKEIGNDFEVQEWEVHIYYLDMDADWATGDARRDKIIGTIEKRLKQNRRFGNLEVLDTEGTREYVFDSSVTALTFDSSGQPGEYSFVTELYLRVNTACN